MSRFLLISNFFFSPKMLFALLAFSFLFVATTDARYCFGCGIAGETWDCQNPQQGDCPQLNASCVSKFYDSGRVERVTFLWCLNVGGIFAEKSFKKLRCENYPFSGLSHDW
jgi:hypothetical protein